ncbi:MAG: hypothetical protein PHV74_05355 [Dehalococcoidia bacterium]|nr:hypothetical protein [Dehalococcoidia bacterium]
METRRLISGALVLLVALLFSGMILPREAKAWGNQVAHPEINRIAIELFDQRKADIPFLKNVTLDGEKTQGIAWDISDGTDLFNKTQANTREKQLKDWIIDGGFSADEPEGPMALRHFYDPTQGTTPWLTDQRWVTDVLTRTLGTMAVNPEISALDWAMDRDQGLGAMEVIYSQEYSYLDAKAYFKQALADKQPGNELYGKAWRALGETMHLLADMGVPAHVRNDGHALRDADPLENATTATEVRNNYSTNWSTAINYNQSIAGLMRDFALYTNRNFFSKDTVPLAGKTTSANGQASYALPDMSALTVSKSGYIESYVDGTYVRQARQAFWYRMGLSSTPAYTMDSVVIADQQRALIPTSVRAAEAVIERFLPRFEVKASVKPDTSAEGKYTVLGSITLQPNTEWPDRLVIRNGAYVRIGQKKTMVKLYSDNLNEFSTTVSAAVGDEIVVGYDLGGYVIESDPVEIQDIPARQSVSATYELMGLELPGRVFGTEDNPISASIGGTVKTAPGLQYERAEWYSFVSGWPPVLRFVFSIPTIRQPDGSLKTEYNDLDVVGLGVTLGEPKEKKIEKDEGSYHMTYEFLGYTDGEAFSMPLSTTATRYPWGNGGSISNVPHLTWAQKDTPIKEFRGPFEAGGGFATNYRVKVTTKDMTTGEETSGVQEVGQVVVIALVTRIVEP